MFGFFKKQLSTLSNKSSPQIPVDTEWLLGIQSLLPNAIICLESRPLSECKTISAAVFTDLSCQTTTVFVNVSLKWLESWRIIEIRPEMKVTEERPRLPQLIIHGDTMQQFNNVTEAHILLVAGDNKATYINFPWNPQQFGILQQTTRWIFWSLADETDQANTYYWGFGDFGSMEAFDDYVAQLN